MITAVIYKKHALICRTEMLCGKDWRLKWEKAGSHNCLGESNEGTN